MATGEREGPEPSFYGATEKIGVSLITTLEFKPGHTYLLLVESGKVKETAALFEGCIPNGATLMIAEKDLQPRVIEGRRAILDWLDQATGRPKVIDVEPDHVEHGA